MPVSPGPRRVATQADEAFAAIDEGLHVAGQVGFRLSEIELLCEQAARHLSRSEDTAAVRSARSAFLRAAAPDCQFAWGAAMAGQLLGVALWPAAGFDDARSALEATLTTRRHLGHLGAAETWALLRSLSG